MCRRRAELVLENLALRQQVTALKREPLFLKPANSSKPALSVGVLRIDPIAGAASRVSTADIGSGPVFSRPWDIAARSTGPSS